MTEDPEGFDVNAKPLSPEEITEWEWDHVANESRLIATIRGLEAENAAFREVLAEIVAGEDEGIRMKPRTPDEAVKAARRVTNAITAARLLLRHPR